VSNALLQFLCLTIIIIMKWGYILVGISVLILLAVLYGQNRRREQFTTMKGDFPNYATLLDQVRLLLDKAYDYDLSELKKMADDQTEMYHTAFDSFVRTKDGMGYAHEVMQTAAPITADDIKYAMDPNTTGNDYIAKYLPKGFKLNVDTPFDSRMASLYARRQKYLDAMKQPTAGVKPGQVPYELAAIFYYQNEGIASLYKNTMLATLIDQAMIRTKAKPKPSGKISIESK